MRVGVDSYSYHRLLGELRPGEDDPGARFAHGSHDVLAHCRALGVDAASLETCFLDAPATLDAEALRVSAGPLEIVLAWGHPAGLGFGEIPGAVDDLLAWIARASGLGCTMVRMVVGHPPRRRDDAIAEQLDRTVPLVQVAARAAAAAGVDLVVENHADLRAVELLELLERVGDVPVGVCLDTANALRVGDDPLDAAMLLAPRVRMLHLKDCERPDGSAVGPRSVPYGQGIVPLEAVLEAVRATDPLVCVELGHLGAGAVDERALVADGVSWLREHA
jgi:sugar phosphate isomerase/epimerase